MSKRGQLSALRLVFLVSVIAVCTSCTTETEDYSFTNTDWRSAVSENVDFPLDTTITLTVGTSGVVADLPNPSRTWLKNRTNIELDYVSIPTSPGEIELGVMMRAGNLPDLISEKRLGYMVYDAPELFVDFTEFRHLTPNFNALLKEDERFRNGIAARFTMDDKLLSLGEYDLGAVPSPVSIAYRADMFADNGYSAETWEDLYNSLKRYKDQNPDVFPFGFTGDSLSYHLPSMFGSGLNKSSIVYFDPDRLSWIAGPFEDEFREFIYYMNKMYEDGIIIPDLFGIREENITQYIARPDTLVAITTTGTGIRYKGILSDYGNLDENGVWDGTGAWYAPLPVPANGNGETGTLTTDLWSPVSDGWLVYTQSEHVAEAIALTDFLLSEDAALVMSFGPEGVLWNYADAQRDPLLISDIKTSYNPDGNQSYQDYLKQSNISFGIPLNILRYNPSRILGLDAEPYYRYYTDTEVGTYLRQNAIPFQPGLRINASPDFVDSTVSLRVGLQTDISSAIAQFVVGQRPLDEYDEFLQLLEKRGLKDLADTYNENSGITPDNLIFGE